MADSSIHKALTFRAASIGDALMGKYFLENIHAAFPGVTLTLLVGSRSAMIADLLSGYPWLNVIEVNRKHPLGLVRAWVHLRGEDITLTQYATKPFSLPSKVFARLVTMRGGLIGFADAFFGNRFIYDHIVPFTGQEESRGMILEEQKALSAAGLSVLVPELTLAYKADQGVPTRFGLHSKKYILAHLFAGTEGRNISQRKRAEIIRALHNALPAGYLLVLTGVTSEYDRLSEAAEGMSGIAIVAGKTSVQELIHLVIGAQGVVALDSGTAHIAAHLKAPLVVLTRTAALYGWWSSAMYNDRPTVLTNPSADDQGPNRGLYPPSLETIETAQVVHAMMKLL